ncbi:hypothetical protein M404DRAFT_710473 [Pisolithus tinctorius Marx 270]|uniref:Uncharacterized protein n=1 Tax=Pisolithus tinctorius Marx 270 TaxID=870435 RepID=A0A0C3PUX9_PISTI|nr:hypothetical protein M404DRAFT_710473 [Pisolithus tinctorius Marx 270]
MQPAIERPLETDSNLLCADSHCHSGSELGDAHPRSVGVIMHIPGEVSCAYIYLCGPLTCRMNRSCPVMAESAPSVPLHRCLFSALRSKEFHMASTLPGSYCRSALSSTPQAICLKLLLLERTTLQVGASAVTVRGSMQAPPRPMSA